MTQPLQAFWGGKEQGQSDRRPENQAERKAKTKMDCLFLEVHVKDFRFYSESDGCHLRVVEDDHVSWNYGCWIELVFEKTKSQALEPKSYGPSKKRLLVFTRSHCWLSKQPVSSSLPSDCWVCSWMNRETVSPREETLGKTRFLGRRIRVWDIWDMRYREGFQIVLLNDPLKTLHWICKP